MAQNGAEPWDYNAAEDKTALGIDINDEAAKEVMDYWAGMVEDGLVGTQDQFNADYISGVIGG